MVCNIPIQADRRSLQQFLCRICGDITLTESYHSVEGQHDQDHSKASFLFQMQCNESERMWSCERDGKSKPLAQMLGNLLVGIASFPCYGIGLVEVPLVKKHQGTYLPDIPSVDEVGLSFPCGNHQGMGVPYFRKVGSIQVLHEKAWSDKRIGQATLLDTGFYRMVWNYLVGFGALHREKYNLLYLLLLQMVQERA